MSSVVLSGDTSGSVSLTVPAVAGTNTVTIPAGTGVAAVQGVSTNIVSGTQVASTSGTSISFTGIPSWAKRVYVIFNGVSTNGTAAYLVQVGSGSTTVSGYTSYAAYAGGANSTGQNNSTAGFIIWNNTSGALINGSIRINNISGNTWVADYTFGAVVSGSYFMYGGGGNVALSGALDRVVITTVTGTPTFTAGAINIQYE